MKLEGLEVEASRTKREQLPFSLEDFEQAFATPHLLQVNGETVEYVKIDLTHEEKRNAHWTVFVGGFTTTKDIYKEEILNLAQKGHRVLFVNPEVHRFEMPTSGEKTVDAIPPLIQSEAEVLHTILEQEGIVDVDIVGHSRGGAVAAAYTAKYPRTVSRLLLDNPAGLLEKDTVLDLIARGVSEITFERSHHKRMPAKKEAFLKRLTNNLGLHMEELRAITEVDIVPLLQSIRAEREHPDGHETKVILLQSNQDKIFPPQKIEEQIASRLKEGKTMLSLVDTWAFYSEKEAGHGMIERPEPGVYPQILSSEDLVHGSPISQILAEPRAKRTAEVSSQENIAA